MEKMSRRAGEKVSKKHTFSLSRLHTCKGFTLVEVLIAILILGGGIFMLLTMFTTGLDGVFANQKRTQATNLAQDLMDEILGKEFKDPQGEAGFSINTGEDRRSKFDDVDDYENWKNKKPPLDVYSAELTLYADFTRSVSVARVDPTDLQTPLADDDTSHISCNRIIVSVSHSDIATVSLYGLKTLSVY